MVSTCLQAPPKTFERTSRAPSSMPDTALRPPCSLHAARPVRRPFHPNQEEKKLLVSVTMLMGT